MTRRQAVQSQKEVPTPYLWIFVDIQDLSAPYTQDTLNRITTRLLGWDIMPKHCYIMPITLGTQNHSEIHKLKEIQTRCQSLKEKLRDLKIRKKKAEKNLGKYTDCFRETNARLQQLTKHNPLWRLIYQSLNNCIIEHRQQLQALEKAKILAQQQLSNIEEQENTLAQQISVLENCSRRTANNYWIFQELMGANYTGLPELALQGCYLPNAPPQDWNSHLPQQTLQPFIPSFSERGITLKPEHQMCIISSHITASTCSGIMLLNPYAHTDEHIINTLASNAHDISRNVKPTIQPQTSKPHAPGIPSPLRHAYTASTSPVLFDKERSASVRSTHSIDSGLGQSLENLAAI